ncbi:MAG: hypothetical protein II695_00450 [Oscillospiraceae bacterium]|nr:hypothetical protein [Oscillospiraceae bacterium]
MKHRIVSALLAAALCTAGISAFAGGVSADENGTSLSAAYRKKYKEILDGTEYYQGVYIGDLVGDRREELVVAVNSFGLFNVYVPVGSKIMKYDFKVVSIWGFTKYISEDREIICMNQYGHTTGAPYALEMEMVSVEDDQFSRYHIKSESNSSGTAPKCMIDGKEVSAEDFSLTVNAMIADTARSEYIPLVPHDMSDTESIVYNKYPAVIDISYDDYIKQKLG